MTASGGSLVARVRRLLAVPTSNDRRTLTVFPTCASAAMIFVLAAVTWVAAEPPSFVVAFAVPTPVSSEEPLSTPNSIPAPSRLPASGPRASGANPVASLALEEAAGHTGEVGEPARSSGISPTVSRQFEVEVPSQSQEPPAEPDGSGIWVEPGGSVLYRPEIVYPPEAMRLGVVGDVFMELTIGSQGEVADAEILMDPEGLGEGLPESVRTWRYAPDSSLTTIQVRIGFGVPAPLPSVDVRFKWLELPEGVTPPTPLRSLEVQYPWAGMVWRMQGTLVLRCAVLDDGSMSVVRVERGLFDPVKRLRTDRWPLLERDVVVNTGFEERAIRGLEDWRFEPGMQDGVPVEVEALVAIDFILDYWPE